MMSEARSITLRLTGIAHGGEALGRHEGRVVFVPYAIPGETVRVEIVQEKERWARTRLLEVLVPSPDRIEPPCPYFGPGRCEGCQWQHVAYPRQLALKREIVADQLTRLGHLVEPPVQDVRAVGEPFAYRNHVQFVISSEGRLGFRVTNSHDVLPVERCLLLHPLLAEMHEALDLELPELSRLCLRAGLSSEDQMMVLETRDDEAPELDVDLPVSVVLLRQSGPPVILSGNGFVEEIVGGRCYRVSAASFFQENTAGAAALLETVEGMLEPRPTDRLLDAYCGVGIFSLALATQVSEVVGIEESASSCSDFLWNAEAMGLDNVSLVQGPVEEALQTWLAGLDDPSQQWSSDEEDAQEAAPQIFDRGIDLAVVDPSRTGMGGEVVTALAHLSPRRVAYVSCDPATLARDAVGFVAAGYRLVEVQPLDMFPQTYHVESVGLWVRE